MKTKNKKTQNVEELLTNILIIELAKAKVPQPEIRKIIGCDMHRINRIAKHFKNKK